MYDDLVSDFLATPAVPGSPSVLEVAFEWLSFAPNGSAEDFSSETGIPVALGEKYWRRFQIRAALDEEDRNIRGVALEWLRQNPNGSKHKFAQELGAAVILGKHLSDEDDPFPDKEEQKYLFLNWSRLGLRRIPAGT